MSTTALAALVRKDLKLFFSDRRALVMNLAAPIAIASFFGYVFSGGGGSEAARIPVQVVDQDGSAVSRRIVEGLAGDKALDVKPAAADAAREAVRKGRTVVAVVIPQGFGAAAGRAFFGAADRPELPLLYDPSHAAELGMVRGILTQHVMQAVSQEMFGGPGGRELAAEGLRSLDVSAKLRPDEKTLLRNLLQDANKWYERPSQQPGGASAAGLRMPYDVREEAVTARSDVAYNGFAHAFAGMGVQFILFASIDAAVAVLQDRQRGLWKRVRSAPISRGLLLAGKAASGALTALVVLAVLFSFGMAAFGIRIQGSPAGFVGVAVASALMASTFGLLVAAVGGTPQATRGVAIFAVLVMVMLGGAWVPSFVFPAWLQRVTLVIPARWAVDGLEAMSWRGLGFGSAALPMAVLLGFALLFGAVAVARFRWEEE